MAEQDKKNIRIQSRADTAANWASNNPVLLDREIGYEIDTGRYKIGNEIQSWNELPYFSVGEITPEGTIAFNNDAWFAGDIYVGGTSQEDIAAKRISSLFEEIENLKKKMEEENMKEPKIVGATSPKIINDRETTLTLTLTDNNYDYLLVKTLPQGYGYHKASSTSGVSTSTHPNYSFLETIIPAGLNSAQICVPTSSDDEIGIYTRTFSIQNNVDITIGATSNSVNFICQVVAYKY